MQVRSFRKSKFVTVKNASDKIGKLVSCWYLPEKSLDKSGIGNIVKTYLELDKLHSPSDDRNLLIHIYVYVIYRSVEDFWSLLSTLLYSDKDVELLPKNKKLTRLGLLVGVWQDGKFINTRFIITQSYNEFKFVRALIKEAYSTVSIS
jgi:hypothetical protein